MPKFLTKQEIYNMIQRELPEDVFSSSSIPRTYYTTSDDDAFAKTVESAYETMERVYNNYFPKTAEERMGDWEITVFAEKNATNATLEERRDLVLSKIRSRKGITVQDVKDIVYQVIGSDKDIEVIEKGCESGVWRLGKSKLSRNTFLGISSTTGVQIPADFEACADDAASQLGVTQEELEKLQTQAYSYTIRVYGYTATAAERARLSEILTKYEAARSKHTIVSPFVSPAIKTPWRLNRSKLSTRTYLG